jgi:hypothetical protein
MINFDREFSLIEIRSMKSASDVNNELAALNDEIASFSGVQPTASPKMRFAAKPKVVQGTTTPMIVSPRNMNRLELQIAHLSRVWFIIFVCLV